MFKLQNCQKLFAIWILIAIQTAIFLERNLERSHYIVILGNIVFCEFSPELRCQWLGVAALL